MSFANCCSVTCKGGSMLPWQTRQVFCARGQTAPPKDSATRTRNRAFDAPLFRRIAIERHRYDVSKRKNSRAHDEFPAAPAPGLIEERQQHPDESRGPENQNADDFTIHEPQFCGDFLERLEHEHEVPLRADSRRSRCEGIRFRTQFPGKNGGQRSKNAESDVPGHQLAKEKVREEFHLSCFLRRGLPALFHAGWD